jgi:hypothetical protein
MISDKLTTMMVEDFIQDPILATKVIFNIDLPPHSEIRLMALWQQKWLMDCSGFGMGKTHDLALCAALRHILLEEREQGIVSRTYSQGTNIFTSYFDKWIATCPIFRSQIALNKKGEPDATHGGGAHVLKAKNGNIIRVIPPDFYRHGDRAKSESWTDGYFSEWTTYPDQEALKKTFFGRVRKPVPEHYWKMVEAGNTIFDRHIFLEGTPNYMWHPAYALYEDFEERIASGDDTYAIVSWNYTHIPKKYNRLFNLSVIENMIRNNPPEVVEMEVYGRWVKDSGGLYSAKAIDECRNILVRPMMARGAA